MLTNASTGDTLATRVVLCDTFWLKFKGLMFRRALDPQEVYVFAYPRESITETTIHMFFVFFSIAVLWLDSERRVVDKVIAKPFRPLYAPKQAAQYFVEGVPELLDRVKLGDLVDFGGK
jgi:uncharacterized membrane protein (UPF0127 family)